MQRRELSSLYDIFRITGQLPEADARAFIRETLGDPATRRKLFDNVYVFTGTLIQLPRFSEQIFSFFISDSNVLQQLTEYDYQIMHYLKTLPHHFLKEIIKNTADNVLANTLLKLINENSKSALQLLQYGIDPTLIEVGKKNLLHILLSKASLNDDDLDAAIALIEYGIDPATKNKDGQDLLQVIYFHRQGIREYIRQEGIPDNKLDDPGYVFSHINIASFSDSQLMKKTEKEIHAAALFIMRHPEKIKEMAASPGGINLYQKHESLRPTFTFFKSARLLCREFHSGRREIEKVLGDQGSQKHRQDWLKHSLFKLNQLRNDHALAVYHEHAEVLDNASKSTLQESIKDTELYAPLVSKLNV